MPKPPSPSRRRISNRPIRFGSEAWAGGAVARSRVGCRSGSPKASVLPPAGGDGGREGPFAGSLFVSQVLIGGGGGRAGKSRVSACLRAPAGAGSSPAGSAGPVTGGV